MASCGLLTGASHLLPALLSLMGDNINRLRVPVIGRVQEAMHEESRGGFWDLVARTVMPAPPLE